jgi:hypothetical protein
MACFACENFSAIISLWDVARIIFAGSFQSVASCRELRELAWQQWIDCVSPIARQYGVESAVIRLSDRWRNYFERGLSPERAVSQYNSDCVAGQFDVEANQTAQSF